jgi:two-component system LytT family response regulator
MTSDKIRTLVVDDEPTARRGMRLLLGRDPEITIIGEATTGREAVRRITEDRPDLVLLDVQMPEMDGFKVLEAVPPAHLPSVIFVTAYDQHALRAFEINAIDYLLKPYDDERFAAALHRAKTEIFRRQTEELSARLSNLLKYLRGSEPKPGRKSERPAEEGSERPDRILLKSGGDIYFLKAGEIDWIEAEGDYMKFHAGGRTHLLRDTMASLEARLDAARFIRIHRSTIVNIDRVKKLSPSFAGDYAVVLQDGTKLKLSRGYHERLQQLLRSSL